MKLHIYLVAALLPILTACGSSSSATTEKTVTKTAATASSTTSAKPATSSTKTSGKPVITVYKSPSCSCCHRWVDHLKANGFNVKAVDVEDVNIYKQKAGIAPKLASCHTAFVNGYIVEGHVPASEIKQMLAEKPAIKGISVPAMPVGTPGMEMGGRKDPYDVVSFDKDGKVKVYKSYR